MSQKPYNSPQLDEIRKKIDMLDTRLHETLVERAALVLKIGEEKRKNNIEIVQPGREARMIRRLLAKETGALPQMAVVRIWRELVGAVSLLQTGLHVCVAGSEENPAYWDLARDYFGSCLPMNRVASPLAALKAVREEQATFAVLPYPNHGPDCDDVSPWWENLELDGAHPLRVIIRLPHGDDPEETNEVKAVVVAKTGFDTSDEDHSFILLECDADFSRAKIVSQAEEAGLKPVGLSSNQNSIHPETRKHFMEVEGFYQDKDKEIKSLAKKLGDEAKVLCAGGFPVPPTYSKTVRARNDKVITAPKEKS
jgi:chorismate mutase